ncbi:Urease subunit beta [Nitrospira sp. KM1]|uniref:urease subunit beta n=1 Tax=Nitrospira sp. KM1 TaxID=1936990 RepID=UPI0013A727F7|nr:urease subunit beta [Nitrospira sp. KM1]BCA56780.1 Urease subunit beta [Nitrospira sp. KM1]
MANMKKRAGAKVTRRPVKKSVKKSTGKSLTASIRAELSKPVIPGEILFGSGDIEALQGRTTKEMTISNTADRPIQVGSHCHFFEVNRALKFDREQAFGFRLQIPAGTAVRFEPGEEKRVTLVNVAGKRMGHGINGLTNGSLDDPQVKTKALARAGEQGFSGQGGAR